ncbi:MAG: hypothetical protein IT425_08180 [Pirellulales bacterium]|nr:hypothetical protein [Pirellulales bacterium]
MMRCRFSTLCIACVFAFAGQMAVLGAEPRHAILWEESELGETAFVPMESAPYPHPSREKGFTHEGKTFPREPHYSDSTVGLFVPRGFKRSPATNVLVYLHGWGNNVRKALVEQKLREQIVASKQNLVLVFPEGPRDASDSGCGKLEDKNGLKKLVEESLATLRAADKIDSTTIGRVLIAGHSGAYRGLACSADHGGLNAELAGVCLLDASYGNLEMLVNWTHGHPRGQLFSIFTDHLSAQNVFMFTHLQKLGESCELRIDTEANDEFLRGSRIVFLHTETLSHNEAVRWLEHWLRTRELK